MTRYVLDLMRAQSESGVDEISILYPGPYSLFRTSRIKQQPSVGRIRAFEITNPTLVPLLNGVTEPERITNPSRSLPILNLERFLDQFLPDLLHLHTLMGLSENFLPTLKSRGIPIVFSTHDYYGLCPRTVFVDSEQEPCSNAGAEKCAICNLSSQPYWKAYLQSQKLTHRYKSFLRGLFRTRPSNEKRIKDNPIPSKESSASFGKLLAFHRSQFAQVDAFHFTSSVSESSYRCRLPDAKGQRISITHAGIWDRRTVKKIDASHLHIGFIGDSTPYKGYPLLLAALGRLRAKGLRNWSLDVHGPGHEHDTPQEGIVLHGPFSSGNAASIYNQMDILVVPSLWQEPFGLVTLEALSFGVPCLVSPDVGSKDLFQEWAPDLVLDSIRNLDARLETILRDPHQIEKWSQSISNADLPLEFGQHVSAINDLYTKASRSNLS